MDQCSSYGLIFCNEDEGMMGEMRQFILQIRMELEATVLAAHEEIMKKEEELIHMKDLLMLTIKERDEAQSKFQKLMLEKLILQQQLRQQEQQQQPAEKQQLQHQQKAVAAAVFSNITNTTTANCISTTSSESDDSSIISSSPRAATYSLALQLSPLPSLPPKMAAKLASSRHPLPEKGQLLKAVMEAGPLLQTLLLAGPLPQWQHPPPHLDSIEIPPLTINTNNSPRKRGLDNNNDYSIIPSPKYQRVV